MAFAVDQMASGLTGLKPLDALLVLAINQANIAPLTRDMEARKAYGALTAPAPDEVRRPVSIHAIATSLRLPFETVRRRCGHLEALGVCLHVRRGVIIPSAYLTSPTYLQDVVAAHARLVRVFRYVTREGLLDPLPASAYTPSDEPPVRAAARLVSDFLLRAADLHTGLTKDIVSGLILATIASASQPPRTSPMPGSGVPGGLTISEVARRLGLAQETARRHMTQLVAQGHCVRAADGRHTTEFRAGDARWDPVMADLGLGLQRLMAGLAERGVIQSWMAEGDMDQEGAP